MSASEVFLRSRYINFLIIILYREQLGGWLSKWQADKSEINEKPTKSTVLFPNTCCTSIKRAAATILCRQWLYCTHANTIFNTFWLRIIPYRIQDCEGASEHPLSWSIYCKTGTSEYSEWLLPCSGFLTDLKCTKSIFGWGPTQDSAGGAYSAPQSPLAGFKGSYF